MSRHSWIALGTGTPSLPTHYRERMTFAIHASTDLKVVLRQHHSAIGTSKASPVVLPRHPACGSRAVGLQILALDTFAATLAHRAVLLVIVLLAIRLVVDDVEIGGREWLFAGLADKALLVPATGQAAIRCFY